MESVVFNQGNKLLAELCDAFVHAVQGLEHRRFPSRLLQVIEGFLEASSIVVLRGAVDGRLHLVDGGGGALSAEEEWSTGSEESLERKLSRVLRPRRGEQTLYAPLLRSGQAVGVFAAALPATRSARDLQVAAHIWSLACRDEFNEARWTDPGESRAQDQSRLRGWAEMARGLQSHVRHMLEVQESATEMLMRAHGELRESPVLQALLHSLDEYRRLADRLRQLNHLLNTTPNFRPVSMAAMARLALQRYRHRAGNVRFRTNFSASHHSASDLEVLADPEDILPALTEIFANAVEYGSGHPVLLDLTTQAGMVTLAVRSKSSMSANLQQHAVELFYSTHQDPARGLGLAIARAIALLHRGSLYCSTSGQWTTIYFSLPQVRI